MSRKIRVATIDSGIPIPDKYSFTDLIGRLEVGESFQFNSKNRRSVASIASKIAKEQGRQFTVRKVDENNTRVWRQK